MQLNPRPTLRSQRSAFRTLIPLLAFFAICPAAQATTWLGAAGEFSILGAASVTNTGLSQVYGDIGVSPGTSLTGLGGITLTGTVHIADPAASDARTDATSLFNDLNSRPFTTDLTGQDLGSVGVLTPGVYRFLSSAGLTGGLVLDFAGHPDQAFIFQIGSTLTTAVGANVTILNGGPSSAIYWLTGSSATLGTGTVFAGNLLADQSITFNTGASILCGRAIALNGSVVLDTNAISNNCDGGSSLGSGRIHYGSGGFSGSIPVVSPVPEPSAWLLMVVGFSGLGAAIRRRNRVNCLASTRSPLLVADL